MRRQDDLALNGTHIGCDTSQCGACTILIDGRAVAMIVDAAGKGLQEVLLVHAVQSLWADAMLLENWSAVHLPFYCVIDEDGKPVPRRVFGHSSTLAGGPIPAAWRPI